MKFAKLAAAVSAAAVASAAFAISASASYDTTTADGKTTEKWVFDEDIATNYSSVFSSVGNFNPDYSNKRLGMPNAGTSGSASAAYISFTAEYDGTLTARVKTGNGNNRVGIIPDGSLDMAKFVDGTNSTKLQAETDVSVDVTAGTKYYIACKGNKTDSKGNAAYIYNVSYTYDTPVEPSAEVTSFEKLNKETLKDENGDPAPVYSVASGLDYPSSGPEHAFLHDIGRVKYDTVSDEEAIDAFYALSRMEGIIPAIESSHAVAHAMRLAKQMNTGSILINLSGRGDKDMDYVIEKYGLRE